MLSRLFLSDLGSSFQVLIQAALLAMIRTVILITAFTLCLTISFEKDLSLNPGDLDDSEDADLGIGCYRNRNCTLRLIKPKKVLEPQVQFVINYSSYLAESFSPQ